MIFPCDAVRKASEGWSLVVIWAGTAWGNIAVEGIADETVYTGQISIRVESEPGYSHLATLNGLMVPVGVRVNVVDALEAKRRFYRLGK